MEASSASLLLARRGLKAVYLSGHISLLRVLSCADPYFLKAGSLGSLRNEVLHHGLEVWATSASQSLWCGSSRAGRVFWVWRTRLQRSELPARRRVAAARRPSLAASAGERVFCLSSGGVRGWSPLGDSDRGRRVRVLCPEAAQWAKFSRAFGWVLHVSEDTHSSQFFSEPFRTSSLFGRSLRTCGVRTCVFPINFARRAASSSELSHLLPLKGALDISLRKRSKEQACAAGGAFSE